VRAVAFCAALPLDGNAAWPNATAGTAVQGVCATANGWQGLAVRGCSASAVWGPITTPCLPILAPCPATNGYLGSTNWPATTAGSTATGSCVVGRSFAPSGPPQRACLGTGVWSDTVVNDCVVGTCCASGVSCSED
jgi:hypothetical protein